jgi:hypothetical protein
MDSICTTTFHAARGALLRRLHRPDDAINAYERVASLAPTAAGQDFLTSRARRVSHPVAEHWPLPPRTLGFVLPTAR